MSGPAGVQAAGEPLPHPAQPAVREPHLARGGLRPPARVRGDGQNQIPLRDFKHRL